jgi:8-oxo-dGTP pyrophosphatase MutT (NUDIX family)
VSDEIQSLIRKKLSEPVAENTKEMEGDFALNPRMEPYYDNGKPVRDAAVLMPLVDRPEGLSVLLTRRADHLSAHAGQVSFPGGRVEPEDGTPIETALRETEEEVGLFRDYVTVWGTLDRYRTGSGYSILPVVAHVKTGFTLTIDEGEVADTFEVPFSFLMDPDNHNKDKAYWQGKERIFYSMPYDGFKIWGATAGILVNLYHRLYG